MKLKTKIKLLKALKWCEDNDKSTEFIIQFLQDSVEVDLDCVLLFLEERSKNSY